MRSRERRACLAAIATQWHAPLAAHTSAARCGPPGPLSAAAGEGGIPANAIARGCRECRTCLAAIATHRWAGASGSHVSHPVAPVRALCRPQPGSRGARERTRKRHGACLSRSDRHAPLAAHVWAARCGPPAGRRLPQPRRAGANARAARSVPVSPRSRRTAGGSRVGPLPAAAGRAVPRWLTGEWRSHDSRASRQRAAAS